MLARHEVSPQERVIIVDQDVDVAARVLQSKRIRRLGSAHRRLELIDEFHHVGAHEFPRPEGHRGRKEDHDKADVLDSGLQLARGD